MSRKSKIINEICKALGIFTNKIRKHTLSISGIKVFIIIDSIVFKMLTREYYEHYFF